MIISIFSIAVNIIYFIIMNIDLYTDRAMMPDGDEQVWQRSPMDRLEVADKHFLFYLLVISAAVSIISSALVIFGVKNNTVKIVRLVGTVFSTLIFIIIMITAGGIHPKY